MADRVASYAEEFGQQISLTSRLREILLDYGEGSILKEIVQNADDARATTVAFCLDRRSFPNTGSLMGPGMAAFQGCALLAYNDSLFSERDFEGISRIGDSRKREEAGKTGRFGIGFNSCYHVTDLPSFVSGSHLVFFDPHCTHLPNVSAANPGNKINFVKHPEVAHECAEQLAPYTWFGCSFGDGTRAQPWQGTLFRLPLRTPELAARSSISKQVYTPDKVMDLFTQLRNEGPSLLLFLKSVHTLQVYDWPEGASTPTLQYTCRVVNATSALSASRSLFNRVSRSLDAAPSGSAIMAAAQAVQDTFQLQLQTRDEISGVEHLHAFLISQACGGGRISALAKELSQLFGVALVPWGAVAADITPRALNGVEDVVQLKGRAFTFLPLPALCGVPVHINGYFELSSNRRDIWHGTDMAGTSAQRAAWNLALLEQVIAAAYVAVLLQAALALGPVEAYYRLWPNQDAPAPWQSLVVAVYRSLSNHALVWTAAEGGRWLPARNCLIMPPEQSQQLRLRQQQLQQRASPYRRSLLASSPAVDVAADGTGSSVGLDGLLQALVKVGLPMCGLPLQVQAMLMQHAEPKPQTVTPALVRDAVRAHHSSVRTSASQLDVHTHIPQLLSFVLSDLQLEGSGAVQQLTQLEGLALLPTLNGSITKFNSTGQQPTLYLPKVEEASLFISQGHILVDTVALTDEVCHQLQALAQLQPPVFNLRLLDGAAVAQVLLPPILEEVVSGWQDNSTAENAQPAVTGGFIGRVWLQQLWQWLANEAESSSTDRARGSSSNRTHLQLTPATAGLTPFVGLPLLPLRNGGLATLQPTASSTVICPHNSLSLELVVVLTCLGLQLLATDSYSLPLPSIVGSYCHAADAVGVLAALGNQSARQAGGQLQAQQSIQQLQGAPQQQQAEVQQQKLQAGLQAACEPLTASQRRHLRSFLLSDPGLSRKLPANHATSGSAGPTLLQVLALLPIYELAADSGKLALIALSGSLSSRPQQDPAQQQTASAAPGTSQDTSAAASLTASNLPTTTPSSVPAQPDALSRFTNLLPGSPYFIAPSSVPAAALSSRFLARGSDAEVAALSALLGVREISAAQAYRDHVLPAMVTLPSTVQQVAARALLHALPQLMAEDRSFGSFVRQVPFVPNAKGELHTPAELYDPRIPEVAALLDPVTSFPCEVLCTEELSLGMLQQLGLRKSLTLDTLLAAARYVEELGLKGEEEGDMAAARGKALLAYLDAEGSRLLSTGAASGTSATKGKPFGKGLFSRVTEMFSHDQPQAAEVNRFVGELARISWCPVLSHPPAKGVPWPEKPVRVGAPRMVRPVQDLWLVSSCLSILDAEIRSSTLASRLGWLSPIPGTILAQQLQQLGLLHAHVSDAHLGRVLAGVVPQLYKGLLELSPDDFEMAAALLRGSTCVWVGNGFASAGRVAFQGSLDLSPWLYVIPAELAPFKPLLLACGATHTFSASQYISVLHDMWGAAVQRAASAAAGPSPAPAAMPGTAAQPAAPLDQQQLAQAIAVVQALADMTFPTTETVYVPDERGVLTAANELAFNDAPWLGTLPNVQLVHPKLSNQVAGRVSVPSLRRLLLAQSSDQMALGMASAEAFGQSEALTTRLRHIIQDYPEGPGVLMELLQNADDAGATEMALLLDDVQYPTDSILAPSMAVWQGPALLCYNNAVFSPSDFQHISRIGQDSKLAKPTSIGRFGLGFNAVYHYTDLPSFVSGESLVILDPHARHLPGINPAQPGLKIGFQRAALLAQFPDAFTPYLQFGCTLQQPYPGTLFRFPLRSDRAAAQSDIKSVPCNSADIVELFTAFREQLPQALLFLKSVQTVKAYVRGSREDVPALVFQAAVKPAGSAAHAASGASLQMPITTFINGSDGRQDLASFYRRLASATQLPCSVGQVLLELQPSNGSATANATATTLALTSKPDAQDVQHDVVSIIGASQEEWAVCNALGAGTARDLAVAGFSQGAKLVPWVGVAARMQPKSQQMQQPKQGGDGSTADGRAFCFLPLPLQTSLPVHVNLYCELSSNRRDIWHGVDMTGSGEQRAQWNVALIRDALAPTYIRLLLSLTASLGPSDHYFSLFPPPAPPAPWQHLSCAFYSSLSTAPLLWTEARLAFSTNSNKAMHSVNSRDGCWLSPVSAVLPETACMSDPQLFQLLLLAGVPLACRLPTAVRQQVLDLTPGAVQLSPSLARRQLAAALQDPTGDLMQRLLQPLQQLGRSGADGLQHSSEHDDAVNDAGVPVDFPPGSVGSAVHPAALLLEYCLSDLHPSMLQPSSDNALQLQQLLQELHGLPLLPLADGLLGRIHCTSLNSNSVGAQSQEASSAKQHADSRWAASLDISRYRPAESSSGPRPATYLLIEGELELALLASCRGLHLSSALPSRLVSQLQLLMKAGCVNLAPLSGASLSTHVLPQLLPLSWRGQDAVPWSSTSDAALQPAAQPQENGQQHHRTQQHIVAVFPPATAWLQQLWRWLGDRQDLLDLAAWPLLPVQGGRLMRVLSPCQVLREGDWTEAISGALQKLHVPLLDLTVIDFACPALQRVLQSPSLEGVLQAIAVAMAAGTAVANIDPANTSASTASPPGRISVSDTAQSFDELVASMQQQMILLNQHARQLDPVERKQLRSFLLQARWFAPGVVRPREALLRLLRDLPIYEVHDAAQQSRSHTTANQIGAAGSPAQEVARLNTMHLTEQSSRMATMAAARPLAQQQEATMTDVEHDGRGTAQGSSVRYVALSRDVRLAPPDTDSHLLDASFLDFDSPAEQAVAHLHLGVPCLSTSAFLASHVVPNLGSLPQTAVEGHVLRVLRAWPEAVAQEPDLQQMFGSWPLIPSSQGALVAARELYDPRVAAFASMLPESCFPRKPFSTDAVLLQRLAALGMHTHLSLQAFVAAAAAIDSEQVASALRSVPPPADGQPPPAVLALAQRGRAVLRHLDTWLAEGGGSSSIGTWFGGGQASSGDDQAMWSQLASLSWCPVLQTAPAAGMPWPQPQPTLAPPRFCRPAADAWMVSATLCIVDASNTAAPSTVREDASSNSTVSNTSLAAPPAHAGVDNVGADNLVGPQLRKLLGWTEPLKAPVVAAQLLELGKMHEKVTDSDMQPRLASVAYKLYTALSAFLDGPEADLVQMTFESREGAACIWVGEGFAVPSVVAFRCEADFRPWLHTVPAQFHVYDRLLSLLGVRGRFTAAHFAAGLRALAASLEGSALDDAQLAMALQLADCAADAQQQYGTAVGPGLYLPDAAGIMCPASELHFNDAAWLEAEGMRLLHPSIPQATAEALAVRSLRYTSMVDTQLTGSLACPAVPLLQEVLGQAQDSTFSFLLDLLEVADVLGAAHVKVMLDLVTHPAQSLLHPGLARCQGPAICVVLPDVVVSADELGDLLCPPGSRTSAAATTPGGTSIRQSQTHGYSLQSAFAVTECLQVISGKATYFFDPSGRHLAQTTAEQSAHLPRAKQYAHVESDLTATFPDQWSVWSFAEGYDVKSSIRGTLLRLPLPPQSRPGLSAPARTAQTQLGGSTAEPGATSLTVSSSNNGPCLGYASATLESAQAAIAAFAGSSSRSSSNGGSGSQFAVGRHAAVRSLLFMRKLSNLSVALRTADGAEPRMLLQAALVPRNPEHGRHDLGRYGGASASASAIGVSSTGGPGGFGKALLASAFGRSPAQAVRKHLTQLDLFIRRTSFHHAVQPSATATPAGDTSAAAAAAATAPAAKSPADNNSMHADRSSIISSQPVVSQLDADSVVPVTSDVAAANASVTASAVVVRESWVVSTFHDLNTGSSGGGFFGLGGGNNQQSMAPIGSTGMKSLPTAALDILASVAFFLGTAEIDGGALPQACSGGLYAPALLPLTASAATSASWARRAAAAAPTGATTPTPGATSASPVTAPGPSAQTLGSAGAAGNAAQADSSSTHVQASPQALPFLVSGCFHVSKARGRQVLAPALRPPPGGSSEPAAVAADAGAADVQLTLQAEQRLQPAQQQQQQQPAVLSSPRSQDVAAIGAVNAAQAEHNRRVLDAAASAWLEAFLWVCHANGAAEHTTRLDRSLVYELLPDVQSLTAAGDSAAVWLATQIYITAARAPVWRLRTGRYGHLPEGRFLQPEVSGLGPAAMSVLQRHLPIFDVPWAVKTQLELMQVQGIGTVTPAAVRPLLKNLGRRATSIYQDQPQSLSTSSSVPSITWQLGLVETTELLFFCCSDLVVAPTDTSVHTPTATSAASTAAVLNGTAAQLQQQPQQGQSPVHAAASQPPPQYQDPFGLSQLSRLLPRDMQQQFDQFAAASNAMLPGVLASMREGLGIPSTPSPTPNGAAPAAGGVLQQQPLQPRYSTVRLSECRGLPIPTAAGTIVPLGLGPAPLFIVPPGCAAKPWSLLPAECAGQFVHPDTVEKLSSHLLDQTSFCAALGLRLYTFADVSHHLSLMLPAQWQVQGIQSSGRGHQQRPVAHRNISAATAMSPGIGDAYGSHSSVSTSTSANMLPPPWHLHVGIAWNADTQDSPSRWWLQQLWATLSALALGTADWRQRQQCGAAGNAGPDLSAEPLTVTAGTGSIPDTGASSSSAAAATSTTVLAAALADKLDALTHWPLLPTADGLLIRVEWRSVVLAVTQSQAQDEPWPWLLPALRQAGMPLLDPDFAELCMPACQPQPYPPKASNDAGRDNTSAAAAAIDLTVSNAASAAALLGKLRNCHIRAEAAALAAGVPDAPPSTVVDGWDGQTRRSCLQLLAKHLPSAMDPIDRLFLATLPLFPTLADTFVAPAAGNCAVCTGAVLNTVPGLAAALPATVRAKLLVHDPSWARLADLLEAPNLTVPQLLATHTIPHLQELPDSAQALLLTHIHNDWSRMRQEPELVEVLRNAPFVLCGDGTLQAPSRLYDPTHPLIARVFKGQAVFPHDQFAYPSWLKVLKDCGLQATISTAAFLAAAQHLEAQAVQLQLVAGNSTTISPINHSLGGSPDASPQNSPAAAAIMSAAEALCEYLHTNAHSLLGREFYVSLAEVAFVPATLGIPGSSRAQKVLARYSEAAAPKDWRLVWSVLPVISSERPGGGTSTLTAQLRVKSPPPFPAILRHLQNMGADGGEEALSSWPTSAGSMESTVKAVLDHFAAEGLSPAQALQLQSVALIPVANASRLVPASALFMRLKESLAPFAYELPVAYLPHAGLLKQLGMQDEPSAQLLLDSLLHLQATSHGSPLNVNQRAAACSLLAFLHARTGAADVAYLSRAVQSGRMPVVSADGRLVAAISAAYVAPGSSRVLGRLDSRHLTLASPALSEAVCHWLGCPSLHEAVQEVLHPSHSQQLLSEIQGLQLAEVRQLLCSPAFCSAVYSVLQGHVAAVRGLRASTLQQVAVALRSSASQLTFVRSLRTRLLLRRNGQDVTRVGDDADVVYEFADGSQLYVAQPPPHMHVSWLMAQVLSRVLGSPITLPLHSLFDCPPSGMAQLQSVLLPGGYDSQLELSAQVGQVGAVLQPADITMLQLKPLRRYVAGELVAYQAASTATSAAAAAAERRSMGSGNDVDVGHSMRYGRVAADSAPSEGQPVYWVLVETEPGTCQQLLSTQVFCFRSSSADTAVAPAADVIGSAAQLAAAAPVAGSSSTDAAAPASLGTGGATDGVSGAAAAAMQRRVAAVELVGAVRDILAAAQLPLSLEQAELMQRAVGLQEQLGEAKGQLAETRRGLEESKVEAEAARSAWQCKICFSQDVDIAYSGCGHLVCSRCAGATGDKCPHCRRTSTLIRLYRA